MALATYTDLQGQVANWMANSGLSGQAADFIALGEATLNRELKPAVNDVAITGVVSSRRIDISASSVIAPIALFFAESGLDEQPILKLEDGTFPYRADDARPTIWASDGNASYIDFDCPLDQAYPFRLRCRQRFALSDASPTNWLLTNHPDVYLAAVLVWSGMYKRMPDIPANMASVLQTGIPAVRNIIAQQNRALLTVDSSLIRSGGYNVRTDE